MANNGIASRFSLAPGAPENLVVSLVDRLGRQGDWPALVQNFIDRGEIKEEMFTPEIRQGMIDHLIEAGITMQDGGILDIHGYDEHFAIAYDHARRSARGADDPLTSAFGGSTGTSGAWDFSVRTFSDFGAQGILPENILAAGAIDYIFELGERMGVFQLCDALVLRWSSGEIDVADGATADRLFRYWKLRDDRSSFEERGMLYKRVLNKGNAKVLGRMVVNEPFPELFKKLMTEVADWINKTEKVDDGRGANSPVSRTGIYQAVREVQYNLTEYTTGMAHKQAHEIYSQLTEALDLLSDPEIIAHFGGSRRKSMWTVIEQLGKAELNRAIPIGPTLRVAVDGNKVFRAIASFDEGTVADEDFSAFIEAAESYILNSAVVGDEPTMDEDVDEEFDDFDDLDEEDIDDDDF